MAACPLACKRARSSSGSPFLFFNPKASNASIVFSAAVKVGFPQRLYTLVLSLPAKRFMPSSVLSKVKVEVANMGVRCASSAL